MLNAIATACLFAPLLLCQTPVNPETGDATSCCCMEKHQDAVVHVVIQRFRDLYRQGKYDQARTIADLAKELYPDNVALATAYEIATIAEEKKELKKRKPPAVDLLIPPIVKPSIPSPPPPLRHPSAKSMIQKVYQVGDLICARNHTDHQENPMPLATWEDQLMKLITSTIQPESWAGNGGRGTMQYYPLGYGLVIEQPEDIQEQVADLLQALRRTNYPEVVLETRVITGDSDQLHFLNRWFKESARKIPMAETTNGTLILRNADALGLLRHIQGDRRTIATQLPRVTLMNGQFTAIETTKKHFYLANVKPIEKDGKIQLLPELGSFDTGIMLGMRPVVSADRRFVRLTMQCTRRIMDGVGVEIRGLQWHRGQGNTWPAQDADSFQTRQKKLTRSAAVVGTNNGALTPQPIGDGRALVHVHKPNLGPVFRTEKKLNLPDGKWALFAVRAMPNSTGKSDSTGQVMLIMVKANIIISDEEEVSTQQRTSRSTKAPQREKGETALIPSCPAHSKACEHADPFCPKATANPVKQVAPPTQQDVPPSGKAVSQQNNLWLVMRTQVRFTEPHGMKIDWYMRDDSGREKLSKQPIETPGRYNFQQGIAYRLKISDIKGFPGLSIYPTLEVMEANQFTESFLAHSALPMSISPNDARALLAGNALTKVIYLPHRQTPGQASPHVLVSTGVEPNENVVELARQRGHILLVMRINAADVSTRQQSVEEIFSYYMTLTR